MEQRRHYWMLRREEPAAEGLAALIGWRQMTLLFAALRPPHWRALMRR
jgi:hypothetical protein